MRSATQLWFDVESINFTTSSTTRSSSDLLWFDVESINFTTTYSFIGAGARCGLM